MRAIPVLLAASLAAHGSIASAQGLEVTPFAGYRFGGDLFELTTGRPVDRDGAPAVGVLVDVALWNGLQFEGFFTHQSADIVPVGPPATFTRRHVVIDHFQGGGLQEFGTGRVRPFLTGMLGLTRYGAAGDNEFRFTLGAGGGVKLFPWDAVGLRLDSRLYATFVDVDGQLIACSSGRGCILGFHTDVAWQAEFSAGVVVRVR